MDGSHASGLHRPHASGMVDEEETKSMEGLPSFTLHRRSDHQVSLFVI